MISNVASCLPSMCQDQHRDCRNAQNQSYQYQQSVVVLCEVSQDSAASWRSLMRKSSGLVAVRSIIVLKVTSDLSIRPAFYLAAAV